MLHVLMAINSLDHVDVDLRTRNSTSLQYAVIRHPYDMLLVKMICTNLRMLIFQQALISALL